MGLYAGGYALLCRGYGRKLLGIDTVDTGLKALAVEMDSEWPGSQFHIYLCVGEGVCEVRQEPRRYGYGPFLIYLSSNPGSDGQF